MRSLALWPGRSLQEITSKGFTWQGRFFENSLILTYGLRRDSAATWQIDPIKLPDQSYLVEESWENWKNDGAPVLDESGDTATKQAVFHIPARFTRNLPLNPTFSLHYSESENFNPASVRRSIYNEVWPSPNGETTEYGFTVNLLDNRASFRFNWYETSSKAITNPNMRNLWMFLWPRGFAQRWVNAKNASIPPPDADPNDPDFDKKYIKFEDIPYGDPNQDGYPFEYDPTAIGPFKSYDEVINTLINDVFPEATKAALNMRVEGELGTQSLASENIPGLTSVADVVSEGFEVESVFNISKSWRLTFNASKTEAIFSNGLKELFPFAEYVTERLKATGLWGIYEGGPRDTTRIGDRWTNETLAPLRGAASKEGTVSTELRKWRFNAVTNYTIQEGRFKGLGFGGAIRWQDKVSTGYPLERNEDGLLVPVLSNPFYGTSDLYGDLWFSYRTRMFDDKVGVKFQLNLYNFIGDDDPMEVTTNPDGQVAIIRAAPEKRWAFTTTFDF
ncbi:MAG: hypothetical protein D6781_05855 [Verrucomicrobia bacterium]|nr:MAG: hypothetical protein D6781_05855 [Verrucomicrobiota bacterium]